MPSTLEANLTMDLTLHKEGDISLWIGMQKEYHNVPNFIANELSWHVAVPPSVLAHLPPPSLPVLELLNFTTP